MMNEATFLLMLAEEDIETVSHAMSMPSAGAGDVFKLIEGAKFVPALNAAIDYSTRENGLLRKEIKAVQDARWDMLNRAYRYLTSHRDPKIPVRDAKGFAAEDIVQAGKRANEAVETLRSAISSATNDGKSVQTGRNGHDKSKKVKNSIPRNSDVADLCLFMKANRGDFPSDIACARGFCETNGIDIGKAQNLLTQANRRSDLFKS